MENGEKEFNYRSFLEGADKGKNFSDRFRQLLDTANTFISEAGYKDYVECNERIMMHVLLDYYDDIYRLKEFHGIEHVRTEKIIAYTVAWIIRRKPLQFKKYPDKERDIFVNERFAAFLMINECMSDDTHKYIKPEYRDKLMEYRDLVFYYMKYRECNPQAIELAIESFKMGLLLVESN